ncbi:MAG: hypothetical protein OES34_08660 [Nitrosopumilus sp.]|nr:hypothetical protein [Nitrosopumilus sp.]
MSSNYSMTKSHSRKLTHFSDFNTLLKILLGLMVITILSSTLAYAETVSVDVEGNSFDVDYTATGMTISGVEADLDFISLIFTVDVTGSTGTLDITFDRSFFDSKFQGVDDNFIILADGDEPIFTEIETTSQSRTLSIKVPAGTEEIEIIGSVFGDSTPEPVVETPEPVVETPKTQCGPGTILKDGVCVLDERCGPGTILKDGECVLDSTPKPVVETPKTQCGPGTILKDGECVLDSTPKPVVETPKTQCGPGTILKDGVCVLDERCGPGTILKDGECVLDSTPKPTETSVKEMGKELVIAIIVSFVIAGIIGIILAIMSKVSKSND